MPTEKEVLAALSSVMDPELNVSLVQAGMVKSVRVDGGRVRQAGLVSGAIRPLPEAARGHPVRGVEVVALQRGEVCLGGGAARSRDAGREQQEEGEQGAHRQPAA